MPPFPITPTDSLRAVFDFWQRGGWIGVDLFFVISGFLISGLLFREYVQHGGIHVGRFYLRRGLKIYPPFYVFMSVTFLFIAIAKRPFPWEASICELLFVQNYGPALWDHTWSLAVEEHFYLMLPLTLIAITRISGVAANPFRLVIPLFGIIALLCLAGRIITTTTLEYSHKRHVFPTHLRLDSLMCGVVIAYFYNFHQKLFARITSQYRHVLMVVGVSLLLPWFFFQLEVNPAVHTIGLTIIYIGSGLLLMACVFPRRETGRTARLLAKIGVYSYSIYLWHLVFARLWMVYSVKIGGVFVTPAVYAAVYVLGSILFGVLLSKAVEMPALALRDRLSPSRSQPLLVSK